MKRINFFLGLLMALLIVSCSGSDTYRGDWKATDQEGAQYDIQFEAKRFNIKKKDEEAIHFEYSQHSIDITNSVETYGIKLDDGRRCEIHFPIADDESIGIITDELGNLLYTISRNDYINYNAINRLH